jgi:hypothetical protein
MTSKDKRCIQEPCENFVRASHGARGNCQFHYNTLLEAEKKGLPVPEGMKPLLPSKKRRRTDLEPTLTAVERQMCENFALDNDIVAGVLNWDVELVIAERGSHLPPDSPARRRRTHRGRDPARRPVDAGRSDIGLTKSARIAYRSHGIRWQTRKNGSDVRRRRVGLTGFEPATT